MLHVFTLGNLINKFIHLRETASLCHLHIKYITPPTWKGMFDKISYMYEAIMDIPDNDIICFIDGFDMIALANESEIIEKFLNINCDLIFGAEASCYPGFAKPGYPNLNNRTVYKYLNAGCYIGYRSAVWKFLNWKTLDEIEEYCLYGSDQFYLHEYFKYNYKKGIVTLDYGETIFQNMHLIPWSDFMIHKGRMVNKALDTQPCFIHFNGEADILYSDIPGDKKSVIPALVDIIKQSFTTDIIFDMKKFKFKPRMPVLKSQFTYPS